MFLQIGNTLGRCCEQAPDCECNIEEDNSPVLLPSPTEVPLPELPERLLRTPYWVAFHTWNINIYNTWAPFYIYILILIYIILIKFSSRENQSKDIFSVWCSYCVASFLHLRVAAAGISSSGRHPLPGLLLLLDPGLHHPSFQDECTDHGRHSSLGPWGCLRVHLLTGKEGKGGIWYLSFAAHKPGEVIQCWFYALFLYLTLSNKAMRPEHCCAATML